ncbi:ventricular zone-expressed PH domain-containing protein homolog 1 isoform X2 [Zonotrichia albicollis]|uniref:ventricular zone-expressed PH domain-containing protein homolog 1 isoform X2 n=1 Tax=Zonotrichia albicollis TaxID=44394 RepID=UPI003D80C26E
MHQLFGLVLAHKDLSRAGDLFSLEDAEIEGSLSEALEQIRIISSAADYQSNDNDQAVVEICITRITTALRETASIERHGRALVALWESCLEHNLTPSGRDEDAPHAKIASDIMSCILQNYNRPPVMALAVPVAVKFLQRGNKELCRNMSSYLSLAAIAKAELLAEHTETIVRSVLQGNWMLLRVLPALYEKQPRPIRARLPELVAPMAQLDPPEQLHLLRLLHTVARKRELGVLRECLPFLFAHLRDPNHSEVILNILLEISSYEPAALAPFLPMLREIGESFPSLIGQTAKIFGAVGHLDEERARASLLYLVNQLANMEHSFHHLLLLEIKSLTDSFSSILGSQSRDIYRMSNSFSAIARLLARQLGTDGTAAAARSKSLALHTLRVKGLSSEGGTDEDSGDIPAGISFSELCLSQEQQQEPCGVQAKAGPLGSCLLSPHSAEQPQAGSVPGLSPEKALQGRAEAATGPVQHQDKLYLHLKENLGKVKEFVMEMGRRIPIPEQCVIEDSVQSCVAKLFFSCPLKGHYCLYSKSSFTLVSQQPPLWIHIMFLFQQSLFAEPLSMHSSSVQVLRALWEKTQLKGTHSFETAMIQNTFPHQKDLESVQMHLEEVRFFDLFGYSEEAGAWQCFMCNNPEKATGMNQDGQPLMEGRLKEKQVRWKFIKRWKTRYFTLAGNQLLFRRGKSKDDPDECPIELSKVQSVKVLPKKRRDRSVPRAFEIFTDSRSYVLKAKDEKNAEQWLQCLNVAVAQARQRHSREATTYL